MLSPTPERTAPVSRPSRLLGFDALSKAWSGSRDASRRPGRPGIDRLTAEQFASKRDRNITALAEQLRRGTFRFSRLRPAFFPKAQPNTWRVICIPTVRDRLVQRAIMSYLGRRKCLPIYNSSSFGFIEERGVNKALQKSLELRRNHDWVLRTDIESFFDRIPREVVKAKIRTALGRNSIVSLLQAVVDVEIGCKGDERNRLMAQGIREGLGLRQGMPLSPVLSNVLLSGFDRAVDRRGLKMVRYADDLVIFANSKQSALDAKGYVSYQLAKIGLSIPETGKTLIVGRRHDFDFLGQTIRYFESIDDYRTCASRQLLERIREEALQRFTLAQVMARHRTMTDALAEIKSSGRSYISAYASVHNHAHFESEIRGITRLAVQRLMADLFGGLDISLLSKQHRIFVGLDLVDM